MKLINLTPHEVVIRGVKVPASGQLARCTEKVVHLGFVNDIPIIRKEFGDVTGLPDPEEGVGYIVSSLVLQSLKGTRRDVFCPGDPVRDENGKIVGCNSLCQ